MAAAPAYVNCSGRTWPLWARARGRFCFKQGVSPARAFYCSTLPLHLENAPSVALRRWHSLTSIGWLALRVYARFLYR